jgi:thiamine phosphate synthase YjbQ (UPF0047 family)
LNVARDVKEVVMKNYRQELWLETRHRRQFINITSQVAACLAESGTREGLLLCNAMHITASVFINDGHWRHTGPRPLGKDILWRI